MIRRLFVALVAVIALAIAPKATPSSAQDGQEASEMLVLVAGASGRSGKHVIAQLKEQGIAVKAMTRNPERAAETIGAGYDWVQGDVTDPASLTAAMDGVTHVISTIGSRSSDPTNTPEGVDYQGVVNLTDAAKAAGVRHVILVSAMGVTNTAEMEPGHMQNLLGLKLQGEDYLRASGLSYTVVRPGGLRDTEGGQHALTLTQGDTGRQGAISRVDLASVSIECMTNPDAAGKTFELIGDTQGDPNAWIAELGALAADS